MEERHGLSTIGQLSRSTGLPVKTIRYYADTGIVPPTTRTTSGYRLYNTEAAARLELVRTLRDLGIDLATIRRVLAHEADLGGVAAAHADALDAQIRLLRLRRAVLRTVAHRTPSEKDITLMNRLARLSAEERRRIIDDYHDAVFGGLELDEEFVARMRSVQVDLPDDPTPEQIDAWVELAELVRDPDYLARVREMARAQERALAAGEPLAPGRAEQEAAELVVARSRPAVEAGIDPASPAGQQIVAEVAPAIARLYDQADTPRWRAELADRFAMGADTRVERYWILLGIVNGHPPMEPTVPAWEWFIAALRAGARD
ncbi:MerR family transcriptional regulator [Marinactinospora thermotolerans]|uniref:DNA-binding transcriptional regulator, MerR family n=1 Tax=Marinactinospora thermotolerans DSM 45154 TaxID=1122192 RepID=A0A1T4NRH1_9ACTN|nr:MerR family transcriptional regulator [Marinactinospora thermotolerans]SJZ81871.1 DNA-binding transcriptional regulator, MerR family [Marinactinospora thermotolerans DSM 45154]